MSQKQVRGEHVVDMAEPPRKKARKLNSNGESLPLQETKYEKAKKEKRRTSLNGEESTAGSKGEKRRKGKKHNKHKVSKPSSEEVVDSRSAPTCAPSHDLKEKNREKLSRREEIKSNGSSDPTPPAKDEPLTDGLRHTTKEEATDIPNPKSNKTKKSKSETAAPAPNGHDDGPKSVPPREVASYTETPSLSCVPESDITHFLTTHSVNITDPKGYRSYRPITAFSHLPATTLVSKSPFNEFRSPTPIQAASWPYGLAGRDMIGVAETGSGKTLAFALPCVEAVLARAGGAEKASRVTRAVIISPTRELAMQTHDQVSRLCQLVGLRCVCVYGGRPKLEQAIELRKGATIICATPGRLKDFVSDGTVALGSASFLVLDEADRMLEKGFEDDIKAILSACPSKKKRQTLMFTATWPLSVQSLAASLMTAPVKITIGRGNAADESESAEVKIQANERIKQQVEVLEYREKEHRALQIIRKSHQLPGGNNDRILVFCLYKKEAVRVEKFFQQRGIKVCSIHGDMQQSHRTESLEAFKIGRTPVLVATDVAARGLDIPEVKLVLNITVSS